MKRKDLRDLLLNRFSKFMSQIVEGDRLTEFFRFLAVNSQKQAGKAL